MSKIKELSAKAITAFETGDNRKSLSYLLALLAESQKLDPEVFHPTFLDLLMDKEVWVWVFEAASQESLSSQDTLALSLIINDLKERYLQDEVFK